MTTPTAPRPLHQIADDINRTWKNVYFGAVPYLQAMKYLDKITDTFGNDSAEDVVIYFLSNATYWRGADAKRIKAELKSMLPAKYR
jgi:hypothetical protein